jgi:hypoxanthine phosphoribosyltransferase
MSDKATVTFDGVSYSVDEITDEGKALLESLKFVEQEIAQSQARIAVLNTAKSAYITSLGQELPVKVN